MELQAFAWWMRSSLTPQHQAEAWSSIYDRIIFFMFISLVEAERTLRRSTRLKPGVRFTLNKGETQ